MAFGSDCSASIAAPRNAASWERRYGSNALMLAASPIRISAVISASRTRATVSVSRAADRASTTSRWPPSARAAVQRACGSLLRRSLSSEAVSIFDVAGDGPDPRLMSGMAGGLFQERVGDFIQRPGHGGAAEFDQ